MKYTIKDVIIYPEDERIVIGDKYYFSNSPHGCIENANSGDGETDLLDVFPDSLNPFQTSHASWQCAIHKKESKKKYRPYDFSNPDVRSELLGKYVKYKEPTGCVQDGLITAFVHNSDDIWRCSIGGKIEQTAEQLMEYWTFWDGMPCGDEVEE